MKRVLWAALLVLLAVNLAAAAVYKYEDVVRNTRGIVVGGATVTVYLADTDSIPTLYTTKAATTEKSNPFFTPSNGSILFYAAAGVYDIQISRAGITDYTLEEVAIGFQASPIEFYFSATAPDTTAKRGSVMWYDAVNDQMKVYDGTGWQNVH